MLSTHFVPYDTQDFSSYRVRMKPADCTLFWTFSNGPAPFIKQYSDYGLTAPLITDMASNLNEPQLRDLGNLTGIYGIDFYTPELPEAEYPLNKQFVEDYRKLYPDEYPNMDAYGGWLAVNLFLQGVKATGGDTTPAKLIEAMSTMTARLPGRHVHHVALRHDVHRDRRRLHDEDRGPRRRAHRLGAAVHLQAGAALHPEVTSI